MNRCLSICCHRSFKKPVFHPWSVKCFSFSQSHWLQRGCPYISLQDDVWVIGWKMNYCRTECIMDGILSRRWIQTGWPSGLRRRAEEVKSCRVDELDTEVQGRGERCVQCDRLSLFNFDNNYLIKMDFFFWHSQPNWFLTFPSFSSSIMRKLFNMLVISIILGF